MATGAFLSVFQGRKGLLDSPIRWVGLLAGRLADFVFPPYCACCHERMPDGQRQPVCGECWQRAGLWEASACQRCGARVKEGDQPRLCGACRIEGWACADLRTTGPFRGTVAEAVHLLKYSEKRSVALRLADLMVRGMGSEGRFLQADLVLAVPLHPAKQRERGYNQAQLLADGVSRKLGLPADAKAVSRTRHNSTQTKLGRRERQDNVRGIFRASKPERVRGRRILLVDDVLTTGATIGSCAQALLEAGATEVLAATAAAAPLD